MLNKKGISPIIAISLLLIVSITGYLFMQDDIQSMITKLETQLTLKDLSSKVEINKVDGFNLYVTNNFGSDLILNKIKADTRECYYNNFTITQGINILNIGSCTYGAKNLDVVEITVFTDLGVVSEYEILRNMITNPLHAVFQIGSCDFASGYLRLYGLSSYDNAHAEDSDSYLYTYNLCIKHYDYNLSLSSGITSKTIISLTEKNNSAVWFNKGSIIQTPAQWFDVNLYSSDGTFSQVINSSDMTLSNYTCLGKVEEDNIYGSHIGDCSSSLSETIWVRLQ